MKTLLHIDASARKTTNSVPAYNSISKSIAASFIEKWRTTNDDAHSGASGQLFRSHPAAHSGVSGQESGSAVGGLV